MIYFQRKQHSNYKQIGQPYTYPSPLLILITHSCESSSKGIPFTGLGSTGLPSTGLPSTGLPPTGRPVTSALATASLFASFTFLLHHSLPPRPQCPHSQSLDPGHRGR